METTEILNDDAGAKSAASAKSEKHLTAAAPAKSAAACASIFPGPTQVLPEPLVKATRELEVAFGRPAWLLLQGHTGPYASLEEDVWCGFFSERDEIKDEPLLVIDSPGGSARASYQIARLFQRRGGFVAVVPRMAKSAATLLALGAAKKYIAPNGELGPLDAQIPDPEREDVSSALNEVQALERLHSTAWAEIDNAMFLMLARTNKRIDTLLPMIMQFEAQMMRPLLEKIDTVHYSQQSRSLKVAEDYAVRLLQPRYAQTRAEEIARRLVNYYPEHGFVIDVEEASQFLNLSAPNQAQIDAMEKLSEFLMGEQYHVNVVGRVREVTV